MQEQIQYLMSFERINIIVCCEMEEKMEAINQQVNASLDCIVYWSMQCHEHDIHYVDEIKSFHDLFKNSA